MTLHLSPAPGSRACATLSGDVRPDFLREETLADIFRATARAFPDSTALARIGAPERLTYAELDRRSDAVAGALARRGVRPGDFVGLWFRRSLELHVAMLGILKAGAAFVPFDADAPAERVATCLHDARARLVLSHDAMGDKLGALAVETADLGALLAEPAAPAPEAMPGCSAPAYAIYTSGSTGTPKGIVVTHRNICHYVRAANAFLGIEAADVVLQQASIAFDLALEEIFVPYLAGATLKVATPDVLQDVDALPDRLAAEGVTVIDTVPTLLSMFGRDVDSLRLVVLGGEACPPALVQRFARPGRRIVNTYGPTEATVVATFAELVPGEAVSIGRPIANATAYVVDEDLRLVGPEEVGELLIGGPGVAPGYLNLPDLTARKFVANPFWDGPDPVLYRTGDAVSLGADGRLSFHGRIDDQVKIRGYRIELGEIEALIAAEPGVQAAAVVVHQGAAGDTLCAHLVAAEGFDPQRARRALAARLPPYMLPAAWQTHAALPRLASGKVDRKALAAIPPGQERSAAAQEPPRSWTEAQLLKAAQDVLRMPAVDLEADFFTDLGGHSMLAARFVSEVRRVPALAGIAIRDVYAHRSLRRIAVALDEGAAGAMDAADLSFEPVPLRRRVLCGLAQAVTLPVLIGIVTLEWIGLLLASTLLLGDDAPLWQDVLVLCGVFLGLNLGVKVLAVALKWLIIGRTRPGVYPLWGAYYFRIWLMERVVQLTAHKFLKGSPLMRIYLRALGAKVGRDAVIDEFEEGAIDLVSIGERASLGTKLKLANVEVIGNQVHVGRIEIGADVQIGNGCVIGGDTVIGAGAAIGDLTAVPAGTRIAEGSRWDGSPGRQTGMAEQSDPGDHPRQGAVARFVQIAFYALAYNLGLVVGLLPIFPAFYVLETLQGAVTGDPDAPLPWWLVAALSWPAALALIVVSMAVMVALRWLLLPRVRPGTYSIFGGLYLRKWFVGLTTESILETLNSLYATVFMRNWYRLMGARIGRGTEISASFAGRYDLIEMGRDNFIGDETVFGDEEIRNGWMTLRRMKTGDRCFFGNSSVIAQGCTIADDALIGIKTRLPEGLAVDAGETFCGSPPMRLPTRQKIAAAASTTYDPPFRMWLLRVAFETLHTSLPTAVLIATAYVTAGFIAARLDQGFWALLGLFTACGLVTSVAMYAMAVACKWLLIGTYRPMMRPMWSWWAMRTEAVAVIYGGLASKMLLDYLRGTPFLPWLLRPFGTRIGKGTWINTTDICEFDCTEIGDHAVLNMGSCPQTHLYEDRIMKVGRIRIGRGVTIGSGSTVLYDTEIGDFAEVKPLTLIMKGETIPAGTAWVGAPAQGGAVRAPRPATPVEDQALRLRDAAE
ncbi:Pls/PosA family non-ribosomal peptide synthetase [Labrys wisconsinensis]|uniref:Non-ribosomal peptide synthetase-like protein n=1 Tax=Labrys wisconsinensis TaxID=425677 RepID=A0ABU0J4E2_9HYPH|nr:Pls/PosA family non-ribosomal peptide synthetase [Labrys wisconsinensis]MDQ0469099.1 non-ribosomal peptide synthetase-like protein [Labrys wisconsinensis]